MTTGAAPPRDGPATRAGPSAPVPTIATLLRDRARRTPDAVAARRQALGIWQEVTWAQYWETAETVGHALLSFGIEAGEPVAIRAGNRIEWLYADVAAVAVRAVGVGVSPARSPAEVAALLTRLGARILLVEEPEEGREFVARCAGLEHVVCLEPPAVRDHSRLFGWDDLLRLGHEHRCAHRGAVAGRMAAARPDDIAAIVPAAPGPPPGPVPPGSGPAPPAAITVSTVERIVRGLRQEGFGRPPLGPGDLALSCLPLSDLTGRATTVWLPAATGVQVHFGAAGAPERVALREVQPTLLVATASFWAELYADVVRRAAGASPVKRRHAAWWLAAADRLGRRRLARGRHDALTRLGYGIGWVVFFRPLRERVGLRYLRLAAVCGAPVAPQVRAFLAGVGVPVRRVDPAVGEAPAGALPAGQVEEAHGA